MKKKIVNILGQLAVKIKKERTNESVLVFVSLIRIRIQEGKKIVSDEISCFEVLDVLF